MKLLVLLISISFCPPTTPWRITIAGFRSGLGHPRALQNVCNKQTLQRRELPRIAEHRTNCAMSARDSTDDLDLFLDWASSRKIFPHNIKVDVSNGRRGVFATEDIAAGSTLLEVPDWLFSYFSTSSVASLPEGWETDVNPENGRPFFVNREEGTLTLNKPVPDLQYFQDFTSPIAGISREMWDSFPWQWTLALRLLAEVERGISSPIVPYLSVLPKHHTTSLWRFSDAQLSEMQVAFYSKEC